MCLNNDNAETHQIISWVNALGALTFKAFIQRILDLFL